MILSLGQYKSHQSRQAAAKCVVAIGRRFPDTVAKHFLDASKEFCEDQVSQW